jgi:nitrogen fixation NifU-like protein
MNSADGYGKITGPCGDTMEFSIKVQDNVITRCTFDTDGCGTTIACASIATEFVIGRTINQAKSIDQAVLLEYCGGLPEESKHCALLAANTLQKTIDNYLDNKKEPWRKLYGFTPGSCQ